MVYPTSDQKAERIFRLLVEEIVPFFGVSEALLSDRGTNLLSHLMKDVCKPLGIEKLNTTAHHPECDGAVERFNQSLKTICFENKQQNTEPNGTSIYMGLCGLIEIPHTAQQGKSLPTYYLAWTVILQQKLPFYHLGF